MVNAEKRKTKKTKHSKTKKTITSSKATVQSIQMENEIHEHVDQTHTSTEQQLQSSRIEFDSLPENTTTELITDTAIEQKAQSIHHSIYPRHEVNVTQTGNEMVPIDMPECKSHAIIDTLQPLNVSETNLNESIVSSKLNKIPNATHILPSITPKKSLTNEETTTNDTYDDLRVAEVARSATAQFEYVAVEAKTIDERYVQENESEWSPQTLAMPRETAEVSITSKHPIEVQLRNAEETISDLPDDAPARTTSIDFDVTDQKSLNVTEIVCEQETSPFQSEPLIASAMAVADFELHRPYNVEETRPSENETTIPLSLAANEKQASVNVTCMDSIAIDQTVANEFETDLVESKPETANADNLFKPHLTMQTNLVGQYEANDSLEDLKYELSRAEIEMNDHNVKAMETVNVYQSEEELQLQRWPDQKQATPTFVTLKSSVTVQMVPNELETELKADSPNAEHATRTIEQTKVLEISSVQPLESVANEMYAQTSYGKQTAKIDFEQPRLALSGSLVYSHEKETDFMMNDLQVRPIVRHDVVEKHSIESSFTESLDSERVIEAEQAQFRQSKIVPGHTLTLGSVNVMEPCDAVESVRDDVETNKNAKLILENVYSVSAYSVLPIDQLTDGIDSAKPNYKFASPNLLCQNAIEISSQSTVETSSEIDIDTSKSEKQQIPLKPSESLMHSANVFVPFSLENVGDVNDLDHKKLLKAAGMHFDEHNQVNVTETLTSEQIVPDDGIPIHPSTVQATSQFTQQTAAAVSVVLPSDSTFDVTYDLPELTESKFTFDTIQSVCVHEGICAETITQMHADDVSKQHRPSSSFVQQIANEQMVINLLENPDVLDLYKAKECFGSTSIANAFVAPEVSNILIHGSEDVFDTPDNKPMALGRAEAEILNAFETNECLVFESSDALHKGDTRMNERAPTTVMQEAFSHSVHIHDVFEKESTLQSAHKFKHEKGELGLESPLKPANVMENVQLCTAEQWPSDHIQRIEAITSKSTRNVMSSAAEETTIIFESESYKEVDSCENVNIATVNVKPQYHVTVETTEMNDSAVESVPEYQSKENKCQVTSEPCLPVPMNETITPSEMANDRKQSQNVLKAANLRVNESHEIDAYETTAIIDCHIPSESAIISTERELHGVEIVEKGQLEKESRFMPDTSEQISRRATTVEHTMQNLIKPIQTYQENVKIHIKNEYYNKQIERSSGSHAINEGKLVCI